jgi:UDP-N-acetylglucosamine 1-carboxyvinyltransferase
MDRIRIVGGQRLNGAIPISGAKNATLPLMIASLLTEDTLILENVPRLADVIQLQRILGNHGVDVMIAGKRQGDDPKSGPHHSYFRKAHLSTRPRLTSWSRKCARASGSWRRCLLAWAKPRFSMPGGCAIGTRPVDLLIMALEKLGAEIEIEGGLRDRACKKGLARRRVRLSKVTVGGTHTALMAASLANGTDGDRQCRARAGNRGRRRLLNKMGAKISGAGTVADRVEGSRHCTARAMRCCPTGSRPAPMQWLWR